MKCQGIGVLDSVQLNSEQEANQTSVILPVIPIWNFTDEKMESHDCLSGKIGALFQHGSFSSAFPGAWVRECLAGLGSGPVSLVSMNV